jgi:hypothetical protein
MKALLKKPRRIYADDDVWSKLREKASQFYEGKGALERYMEDIAKNPILIIRSPKINLHIEMR